VEPRHRSEVRGQGFALARLKLLDEVIHGLLDDYLSGVVFLARSVLIRRVAAGPLRRIFPVRCGAAGYVIAGVGGCVADSGWHNSVPHLLPAVGDLRA